jgi:hypothetical protein
MDSRLEVQGIETTQTRTKTRNRILCVHCAPVLSIIENQFGRNSGESFLDPTFIKGEKSALSFFTAVPLQPLSGLVILNRDSNVTQDAEDGLMNSSCFRLVEHPYPGSVVLVHDQAPMIPQPFPKEKKD